MTVLPLGWTTARIDELGQIVTGSTPSTKCASYYGGTVPFVRPPDLQGGAIGQTSTTLSEQGASNGRSVPMGSVLVGCIGSLGKTGMAATRVAFNQQINAVVPHDPNLSKWILHAVQTSDFRHQLRDNSSATTIAIVNKSRFCSLKVSVAPLLEQHRIVEAIESYFTRLDDAVATLERVQRHLKRYSASVLKAAVEGRLVPTEAELARAEGRDYEPASVLLERILAERRRRWEEAELAKIKANGKVPKDDKWKAKYEEPTAPDVTSLRELPEGWCWASIDQLGEVSGGVTQNAKRAELPMQVPFLRVANVYANELRLDDVKAIGVSTPELSRTRLASGDLLIVEGNGSIDQIGRVALWDGSIDPCLHQNHLIKVRFVPVEVAKWSLCWLLAPLGRVAIERAASSTSGLHTLSLSKVAQLPVPVAPLAEQLRIAAEVDRLFTLCVAVASDLSRNVQRCARLRQSILKCAFEGRLVDQDLADEPASVLLERIKAEREAKPTRSSRSQRQPSRTSRVRK